MPSDCHDGTPGKVTGGDLPKRRKTLSGVLVIHHQPFKTAATEVKIQFVLLYVFDRTKVLFAKAAENSLNMAIRST